MTNPADFDQSANSTTEASPTPPPDASSPPATPPQPTPPPAAAVGQPPKTPFPERVKQWLIASSSRWFGISPEYKKGNRWYQSRQYEEALSCYEAALALNPQFRPAWVRSGQALGKLNRASEAIAGL